MQQLSSRLTELVVKHGLLDEAKGEWFQYLLEKKLTFSLFLVIIVIIEYMLNRLGETISFLIAFNLLRRRIGGWHLTSLFACQLTSIVTVVLCVNIVGPVLANMAGSFSVLCILTLLSFLIKPVYPVGLNFPKEVIEKNNVVKNYTIVCIYFICVIHEYTCSGIGLYYLLGINIASVAVLIEYCHQRKVENHEKDQANCFKST